MSEPLLWIGSDRHALDACLRAGVDVILVQGASGRDFGYRVPDRVTRRVFVDDQRSVENVLAALIRQGLPSGGFRAVATNDERTLITAAALARLLDCPGPDAATVIRFRDKAIQKQTVAAAGVPVARFVVIDDIQSERDWAEPPSWPVVVKPVAGAATSATRLLHTEADRRSFVDELRASKVASRTFIVEEFVPGEEWQVDGVVSGGEVRFLSVGTYGRPCLEAITAKQPVRMIKADPVQDAWMYELARPLATRALSALGLQQGIFHMELFYDRATHQLWFGECAARRGGGLTQEEILFKFGVNLAEAAVRLAVEGSWSEVARVRPGYVGSTFLPLGSGTLLTCPSADDIAARPGVTYAHLELPLGFTMAGSATDTVAKLGQALLQADTRDGLNEAIDALLAWFTERVHLLPPGAKPAELREHPAFAGFPTESGRFR